VDKNYAKILMYHQVSLIQKLMKLDGNDDLHSTVNCTVVMRNFTTDVM